MMRVPLLLLSSTAAADLAVVVDSKWDFDRGEEHSVFATRCIKFWIFVWIFCCSQFRKPGDSFQNLAIELFCVVPYPGY